MIVELNPKKWFGKKPAVGGDVVISFTDGKTRWIPDPLFGKTFEVSTPAKAVESNMSFIGVLEAIGKGFMKGLGWAVQYAVPVEKLIALLFPAVAPEAIGIEDATTLIQNAVLLVEQKYAASGVQNGTGQQKAAEVLTLTGPAVTSLLAQAGIKADTAYIQKLITVVVGILNVQSAPSGATATATA